MGFVTQVLFLRNVHDKKAKQMQFTLEIQFDELRNDDYVTMKEEEIMTNKFELR